MSDHPYLLVRRSIETIHERLEVLAMKCDGFIRSLAVVEKQLNDIAGRIEKIDIDANQQRLEMLQLLNDMRNVAQSHRNALQELYIKNALNDIQLLN
jgi:hypothetical protein